MHKLQHREKETTKDLKVKGKKRISLKEKNSIRIEATFATKTKASLPKTT